VGEDEGDDVGWAECTCTVVKVVWSGTELMVAAEKAVDDA